MNKANFYSQIDKDLVRCELCHHSCVIKDGDVGLCSARLNQKGKLYSLNYGYPAAMNIDPIEKKPLYHFMPGSYAYSIGTYGCNLRCQNCQNYSLSQAANIGKLNDKLSFYTPEKIVEDAIGNECQSIAFTYNEPTIFAEYALDIMKIARKNELRNVWVTNGFMGDDVLESILPWADAFNVDLKSMDDDFYKRNCGARLQPILDNLKRIKSEQIHLEVTTLIIPGYSDDTEMLSRAADFIVNELDVDVPWHLSLFDPSISWKMKDARATSEDIIYEAYEIGKDAGLKYVYVGNIPGDQKENTYCPKCGELAISRHEYVVERFDNSGRCAECDKSLDIID